MTQISRPSIYRAVGIALLMLTCVIVAPREAPAQDAASFISSLGTRGLQALSPSRSEAQKEASFRDLLVNNFDLPGISRFVLGPYARTMSPAALQEFEPLFRDYLTRVYTQRLGRYADAPFRVTGSRPFGAETVVTSQVWANGNAPVDIDWHVQNQNGRFVVTDVVVGGVSMKATQRSEFASVIQRNGGRPDSLIGVLRQQLAAR
ncbi:MAG: phospholipid-binding protein MlaC [Alphaproteobacteria bacterium]